MATNFLHESDKFVSGSSSAPHKYEGSVSMSSASSWKIIAKESE